MSFHTENVVVFTTLFLIIAGILLADVAIYIRKLFRKR